ncbi:hypothetical protein CLU93_5411 [Janthinobacterium sp. 35]|uniref:hypothetical protein n=1 Tax=Janthinobacterium sp. 35 TaxID=2035210 RepID=UPI000C64174C|nr:hypothetical protein [Janthinobacterium sp. 35]PIG31059.1 hypothetical protein CLU93_5411 [Janthinobacterium sp. 35]
MPTSLAGSTLAVSQATPADVTAAGFAALSYTQIKGVKVVGEVGTQYATSTRNCIGLARPYQAMAGLAELSLQVELIRIADAGQDVLRAMVGLESACSYRATRPDGSLIYFTAQVNGLMNGSFTSGSIAEQRCNMAVLSKVIEVD